MKLKDSMQITIPDQAVELAWQRARETGCEDLSQYMLELILGDAAPTDEELAKSLALIDLSMEEIAAGQGMTIEESRQRIQQKLGLPLN
jgi:hypothetical protein